MLRPVVLFAAPWTVASNLLCPWDFPGKNTRKLPFPPPGDLPNPGIELKYPVSPALQVDSLPAEPSGKPHSHVYLAGNNE